MFHYTCVYACFLKRGDEYIHDSSFSNIQNPSLDVDSKMVLSTWRNSAASHSWAMYTYTDGVFIDAYQLTRMPYENYSDDDWIYVSEKRVGVDLYEINEYCTKDYSSEEFYELIYSDDSFWKLNRDRWTTWNIMGSNMETSIFNSSSIDAQIKKIIKD